jgi:[ribosomal protein S5]-alanine N-acetyltransferase
MTPRRGSSHDAAAGATIGAPRLTVADDATAIRPLEPGDAAELLAVRFASREHLAPWEPAREESYFTEASHRAAVEADRAAWAEDRGFAFAVLDAADGRMVGGINLSNVVRGAWQNATVGYWLAAADTGRGHATRALRLAIAYGFAHCDLHRVQAAVIPRNTASLAVVRRAGLRHEGRALRYLRIAGVWEDHEIFAATVEDVGDLGLPSLA